MRNTACFWFGWLKVIVENRRRKKTEKLLVVTFWIQNCKNSRQQECDSMKFLTATEIYRPANIKGFSVCHREHLLQDRGISWNCFDLWWSNICIIDYSNRDVMSYYNHELFWCGTVIYLIQVNDETSYLKIIHHILSNSNSYNIDFGTTWYSFWSPYLLHKVEKTITKAKRLLESQCRCKKICLLIISHACKYSLLITIPLWLGYYNI